MHKLDELVEIRSGYTFRHSFNEYSPGDTYIIHASSVTRISDISLPAIDIMTSGHNLQDGDVLLAVRGEFKAQVFRLKNKAIAASTVMILRPISDRIIPEYLALYFNSSKGQESLSNIASGSAVKSLTKSELAGLNIPVPAKHVQNHLVMLADNIRTQQQLARQRQELLDNLFNGAVTGLTKETAR